VLRPSRLRAPAVVLAALAAAFFGISRTSGSGWATVLVALLLGALLAGAIAPVAVLARSDVAATAPTDATVSLPVAVDIVARAGMVIDIPELGTGPCRSGTGTLTGRPPHRGVVPVLRVELQSAWPLGMVTWRRTQRITLARPVEVGPLPAGTDALEPTPMGTAGDGEVRGVRNYVPGDRSRDLHWPATARTGEMMVRETDGPVASQLFIVVDLAGPAERVEPAASRAAGLALAGLRQGLAVVLATAEAAGPVTAPVQSAVDVSRRLARAVVGPIDPTLGQRR
jgi:uncharacterized protein (DUF58 family)